MARRAASISRAVMRARLVALRPYSPNDTELPRWAKPVFVPLNILRYLVRLGCCMVYLPSGRRRRARSRGGCSGGRIRGGALCSLGGLRGFDVLGLLRELRL